MVAMESLPVKLSVFVFGLLGALVFPAVVLAESIALQGGATMASSGGMIHFTDHNSNVALDSDTGLMAGYAWSDDLGWVAFGTEDNEQGPVRVDLDSGEVGGFAKVLGSGGFIDFGAHNSNVILNLEDATLTGYLFDPTMGWINFGEPGVSLSQALPEAPEPTPATTLSPTPVVNNGGLPTTGSALGDLAVVGGGLITLGGGLQVYRKRRQQDRMPL